MTTPSSSRDAELARKLAQDVSLDVMRAFHADADLAAEAEKRLASALAQVRAETERELAEAKEVNAALDGAFQGAMDRGHEALVSSLEWAAGLADKHNGEERQDGTRPAKPGESAPSPAERLHELLAAAAGRLANGYCDEILHERAEENVDEALTVLEELTAALEDAKADLRSEQEAHAISVAELNDARAALENRKDTEALLHLEGARLLERAQKAEAELESTKRERDEARSEQVSRWCESCGEGFDPASPGWEDGWVRLSALNHWFYRAARAEDALKQAQAEAEHERKHREDVQNALAKARGESLAAPSRSEPASELPQEWMERTAEAVHEAYLATCAKLGWDVKPANRVPYAELSEASKELDRASVRAVLASLPAATPSPRERERDGTRGTFLACCGRYFEGEGHAHDCKSGSEVGTASDVGGQPGSEVEMKDGTEQGCSVHGKASVGFGCVECARGFGWLPYSDAQRINFELDEFGMQHTGKSLPEAAAEPAPLEPPRESDEPTDADLRRIAEWPHTDFPGLMSFVRSLWWMPDWGWNAEGVAFELSTGGHSDNEALICALQQNTMFWLTCFQSHRRGGHYEFKLARAAPPDSREPK